MATVPATRQALADAYKVLANPSGIAYLSLHTDDPKETGASEATGGGYQRQEVTWNSGTGGLLTAEAVTFQLAAGTYSYAGIWDSEIGGKYLDGAALTPPVTLGGGGPVEVTPGFTET
ncbi:phage tail fiber protein [Nocardia tengchongensis]